MLLLVPSCLHHCLSQVLVTGSILQTAVEAEGAVRQAATACMLHQAMQAMQQAGSVPGALARLDNRKRSIRQHHGSSIASYGTS